MIDFASWRLTYFWLFPSPGMSSKFSSAPQDKTAQSGDTVQLRCKPKFSVPQPVTVWKYEANTITQNNRFTVLPSGSLQIQNVQQSDSGRYKCIVTNSMVPREIESDYATLSITKGKMLTWWWLYLTVLSFRINRGAGFLASPMGWNVCRLISSVYSPLSE